MHSHMGFSKNYTEIKSTFLKGSVYHQAAARTPLLSLMRTDLGGSTSGQEEEPGIKWRRQEKAAQDGGGAELGAGPSGQTGRGCGRQKCRNAGPPPGWSQAVLPRQGAGVGPSSDALIHLFDTDARVANKAKR